MTEKILVVDDEPKNVKLLADILRFRGYAVVTAESGEQALACVARDAPDLLLLDVMMPGIDGFEVARRLKANEATRPIPIILVTALNDRDSKIKGLDAGAEDFLGKPVDRVELEVRVRNLLLLKSHADFLRNHNAILEAKVAERTRELRESFRDTVATLIKVSSYKDEETGAHVKRISYLTSELARQMGMGAEFVDLMFHGSPMHDVGKIGIPDLILKKPGGFTPDEWAIMKSHSAFGAQMLAHSTSPFLRLGAEIAQSHHERWDGGGYPAGLQGESIPLSARIMNICDQYDALRSQRPYKPAFEHARTVEILTLGDGRTKPEHFAPAVLAAFRSCAGRFEEIFDTIRDGEQAATA